MKDISPQLIEQVQAAQAADTAVKIEGGGSKQHLCGRDVEGEILSTKEHQGIIHYDPNELVLTALAGTKLTELNAALDENAQMLSFEPPHFSEAATLGGTLACNQSGPARPWGGSIRDMVLGVRLINGKAEHLRFGGQVMKNVAGYDVARLQAGALGCLGIITEVSFKVLPKAETSLTLVQELSQSAAISRMNELSGIDKPLSASAWVNGQLYLRLSGTEHAVQGTAQSWGGEALNDAEQFWQDLREQQLKFFTQDSPLWRFSICSTAEVLISDVDTVIDWGGAQRWLKGDYEAEHMQQLAAQAGGHATLFSGGDRTAEVRQPLSEIEKQIQKRLKFAFDPEGILNPGRLYSWM